MTNGCSKQLPSERRRACLIFDSDSQYFACWNLVPYFRNAGWLVDFIIVGPYEPPRPVSATDIPVIRVAQLDGVWKLDEVASCDALGAYLPGSKLRQVWLGNQQHFERERVRPVLFTGYNGVVLQRFEDGLSWRCGYDLIALNSPEDHEKALAFGNNTPPALMPIIGINRTHERPPRPATQIAEWTTRKKIVFAEQVLFPGNAREKFYLYSRLIDIALKNPDWKIVIKPRTLPESQTFHRQAEHVSHFISRKFILPKNVTVCYDPLDQLLEDSTVLLSISSTAFFDAVGMGVPSYTLSDFGVTSAYGTHYFHRSGCTICLAEINHLSHDLFVRRPAGGWLEFKGFSPRFSPEVLVAKIGTLVASGHTHAAPLAIDPEQRVLGSPAVVPSEHLVPRPLISRLFGIPDRNPQSMVPLIKTIARIRRRIVTTIESTWRAESDRI